MSRGALYLLLLQCRVSPHCDLLPTMMACEKKAFDCVLLCGVQAVAAPAAPT
jgi:hypothetical protein